MNTNVNNNIVVTIGRQFGSGGRELGQKLAKRLGFSYFDKELLSRAAEHSGVSREFFEQRDERFPSFLNGLFSFAHGYNSVNCYCGSTSISDDSIYRAQSELISQLASEGSCVIVGRTADYVLRDYPHAVNVFVHANEDDCARRIMSRNASKDDADEPTTIERAKAKARKINKLRANYYNFYTDKTWGAASSYDLTFNTSTMPIDDIVEVIAKYISLRFGDLQQ